MKKISKLVLMLCLVFSGAFSYAHGIVKTREKIGEDSTPILIIEKASYTSSEKGNSLDRGDIDTYHPTIFSPSDESTKVYPHVILGGTGCVANVSSPTAIWAEQDIILDKGFQLSSNTAFSARVIKVPDPEHSKLYIQNCQ